MGNYCIFLFKMAATANMSTVPLMMDVEGQDHMADDDHDEPSIKNDFAYNNNVAGAAKHIRMGKKVKRVLMYQGC